MVSKIIGLLSIVLGIAAALSLYKGGSGGAGLSGYANQALLDQVRRVGQRKKSLQIIGLVLILLSLVLQGILLFPPTWLAVSS
jgi:hypothetical protein